MDLKNNQGIAFLNEKTKDTQPDFKGELNIDGKTYQVAIWKRVAKNNKTYLSLNVDDKSKRMTDEQLANVAKPIESNTLNDEIPW